MRGLVPRAVCWDGRCRVLCRRAWLLLLDEALFEGVINETYFVMPVKPLQTTKPEQAVQHITRACQC